MPRFTVVIPLYNKENYIAATLNSVLTQTFTDFEILVVNDSSTDNSSAVVSQFADDRLRVIEHSVNRGLSASRNTGIKEATAKYIAFLDADDLWKTTFLESINTLIDKFPQAGLFATGYEEVYPMDVSIKHSFDVQEGIIPNFFKSSLNQSIYYPSCLCVAKEVFDTAGYYDEAITFGEDIDFNIRAHANHKLAFCPQPLVQYTMHSENQITHASLKNKVVTDFDKYEAAYTNRPDIKKYIDFHRYVTAKLYRISGDMANYKRMKAGINLTNLNLSQQILLNAPCFILKAIRSIKKILQKKGINPTTY
ncbi:MAG: glycosyltransferase family 2 protein [Flavobacterium sp.]|nr:MAG: glycosyltransferase family 2 protein [Flavobacterium sp.]